MKTRGKKYQAARQQVPVRMHSIEEAVPLLQKAFDLGYRFEGGPN